MRYSNLGKSGLQVSALTLGTLPFGGHQRAAFGHLRTDEARRLLDLALDAGVNLVDTADVYGYGRSEEMVGEIVRGRRGRILIATKCRARVGPGPNDAGLSRHHIIESVNASLGRLATDHIDLYQLHGWDERTPLEETIDTLNTLITDGKVRYFGCSNFAAWQVMKGLSIADQRGARRFVSQQIYYSAIGREAERELIPMSIDQGVGVLVWSPLAGGLLTGRHTRNDGKDGAARVAAWFEPPVTNPSYVYDVVDALTEIAATHGASVAQVSLAYLLAKPGVTSVIAGPRTDQELVDSLGAVDLGLIESEIAQIDQSSALPLPYPQWHQTRSAASGTVAPGA